MEGADKETTPVGRWLHKETPCATCVPYSLMPINIEAYDAFVLARNALMRDGSGKAYDVDVAALASVVIAKRYGPDCLSEVINLMRYLLYEEVI